MSLIVSNIFSLCDKIILNFANLNNFKKLKEYDFSKN